MSSEHNTNFDTLYTLVNGNIDNNNIKSGAAIDSSKLDLSAITQNTTFAGTTIADLGTVTTVDINGGTIDGVTIGASSAPTVTNLGSVATCDINGGTVNGITSLGLSIGANITEISIDGTLADNSDTAVPTEKAVKTYVDNSAVSLGAWANGVFNSATQVSTDGFLLAYATYDGGGNDAFTIKTDSSSTPTTIRAQAVTDNNASVVSIFTPVKSGDYYLVQDPSGNYSSETVFFIPLS